ncbi:MAG: DUF3336 domain-containing protein [Pseudomonadales bacterium]|nr:DUF3336 domain-containing protein [Pseudomonadales bacterium]
MTAVASALISLPTSLTDLETLMAKASSYADWLNLARQHDQLSGAEAWRSTLESSLYDYQEICNRLEKLQHALQNQASSELLYALNEGVHGNMGGMGRPVLYSQARCGTKHLIEDYVTTIAESLRYIHRCPESEIPHTEKVDFFRRASHCYGRSALLLSGGAGLIYFHHGVVQELIDNDLLPGVISGASAGAIVAAQLGTLTDEELRAGYFIKKRYHEPLRTRMLDVFRGKVDAQTAKVARENLLDEVIPRDITFQEAYEKTGRYINISISPAERHQSSRLMNAITSPNVYVRSAISASMGIPGLMASERLFARGFDGKPRPYLETRRWVDGSLSNDLPAKRMARLYGVNHFIVSLINPMVVPFIEDVKSRQNRGLFNVVSESSVRVTSEVLTAIERVLATRGTKGKALAAQLAYLVAMLGQSYLGDINILIGRRDFRWRNALFEFRKGEVEAMIQAGRRHTWPKMSMIRNAAMISHTLDQVLESLSITDIEKKTDTIHHVVV